MHGGEVLFTVGDPAESGYLVQDGSFTLRTDNANANAAEMTVARGTLLGELALLTETTRPVTRDAREAQKDMIGMRTNLDPPQP